MLTFLDYLVAKIFELGTLVSVVKEKWDLLIYVILSNSEESVSVCSN